MTNKNSTYKRLGDYIEQRREKNKGFDVPIRGVSKEGFIPPKQQDADVNLYNVFYKNDFVFNPARMELNSIALNEDLEQGICSSLYEIFYIKDTNVLDPLYLNLLIKTDHFTRFCEFVGWGSVREYCRFADISEYYIEVPPIEEQHKIVSHFNAIRTRIANNKQTIAKLEEAAQALYRKMFVDDVDVENLPEGWRMGCLGEVCSKIGSGSTPKGGKDSYLSEGISLIRSMNVFDFYFEREDLAHITESQAKALDSVTVQEKDILLNITGASVGRCCMVPTDILPARVNQHVMIIRANEINYQIFLLYQINSERTKRNLLSASESGSTREALTKGEVEMQKILIPAESDIEKFSKIVDPLIKQTQLLNIDNLKMNKMLSLMA